WPHHLTIARLVARALRLNRNAVLEISAVAEHQGRYRLSYLAALLLAPQPAILVASPAVQSQLLLSDIPCFRDWTRASKPIYQSTEWPGEYTSGLLLLTPEEWLTDIWSSAPHYPQDWPIIVDQASHIESWARDALKVSIGAQDWDQLMWAYPQLSDRIRDIRAALTQKIFQHPSNPYNAVQLDESKKLLLLSLQTELGFHAPQQSPTHWQRFWAGLKTKDDHSWIDLDRETGQFQVVTAPTHLLRKLSQLFESRATVMMGSSFGLEPEAYKFRQALKLEEATYVHFAADRNTEAIQIYLPDRIPMPNTKEFQGVLLDRLKTLIFQQSLDQGDEPSGPWVIIVDDTPLKAQVASQLASVLGSRVIVESTELPQRGILISGWSFWLQQHGNVPSPQALLIATLPIPSPENPKVAARIDQYKRQRLDWFRLYLLPTTVQTLQKAIAPIRNQDTFVTIYDNRLLHRSYGSQILNALSPYARVENPDFLENGKLRR
ncbi:MAG: ATP-dependent DNA helicase, partial [Acaryochloridaceae cyanobacterium RL_2_7]|nr:ATP-dependent DNA helicase [Acaryochloridaceae cyanobacterium RL_2_7]